MTSRERVLATLDFRGPDRLPTDFWPLPSTWYGRETEVNRLLARFPRDLAGAVDIYPDLIEMGVEAINSQVWCMGLDSLARFAGRIIFWGELDRQEMLPRGTPARIRQAAQQMVDAFYRQGGLIGQSSVDKLSSLANLEAAIAGWHEARR